jgi:hypothetical protein
MNFKLGHYRNLTTRRPGRPRNPDLTDEDRRAHRLGRPRPPDPNRPVAVKLSKAYNINGQMYGPGEVTVPYCLAQELTSTESRGKGASLDDIARGIGKPKSDELPPNAGVGIGGETYEQWISRNTWKPPEPQVRDIDWKPEPW